MRRSYARSSVMRKAVFETLEPRLTFNTAPIARADVVNAQTGVPILIDVLANDTDPDGDSLSIDSFFQAWHGTVELVSGVFRYTSGVGYTGLDSFTYFISDGQGGVAGGSVTIAVQPLINSPPVAQADSAVTQAATAVTINVLANDSDPDGDSINVSNFTQPSHGTVTSVSGGLRYTPTAGYSGADTFNYTVSDSQGATATATVSLTVQAGANQAPVAGADSATTQAATAISINVLANDSDPDSDVLSISSFTQASHGTVAAVSGGLRYTPTSGYSGTDSFNYTVSDGRGGTATATVSLTVQPPPNVAPTAVADVATTQAATAVTINVLANDSDPNGDSISVSSFTQPLHGTLASVSGGLRYTPISGYSGADSFTYTISDGRGGIASAAVSVTVQPPPNVAPTAVADAATTQAATAVTINVLANDSDPNGDAISILSFTQALHGTVASVSGGLRYTPTSGYSGADSFTYTISDGRGGTATATVSLTVQPPANIAPTAVADVATTQAATAVTINVLANDSDPNGDSISVSTFTQPLHGTVTSVSGGLRYTPTTGYSGGDSFTYTISDGRGGTATALVSVTVQPPPNVAPVAVADVATMAAATAVTINVLANDSDPNGDLISVSSFTQPLHGTVASVSGGLRYTPTSGYSGVDSFNYTISDGRGGTATTSVSVTVLPPPNVAPTAVPDSASTEAGTAATIDVLANDSDPDGDSLSVLSFAQPGHGTVALVSGMLRYTPTAGYLGADAFSYTISDGRGGTATTNVSITVVPAVPTSVSVVNGVLSIAGRAGGDVISITGVGNGMTGQYVVVTGQGTVNVSGVLGNIQIDLGDSDDEIVIDNAFVNGNITINTGGGNDVVRLGEQRIVSTRFDLNVSMGDGDDQVEGKRLYIGGNQTVNGGAGNDQLSFLGAALPGEFILGTSSGGATTITGDAGNDAIQVSYTFIVGQWQVNGGAGDDTINVRTSACNGAVFVNGDAGADTLVVDTNFLIATLWIGGGSGVDRLELRNSLGLVAATIAGGDGNDTAAVSNLTSRRLTLHLGAQDDTVDVRSSLFDELFANLGDGNDTLTLYGNLVRGITEVDGSTGGDAFFDFGNGYLGGIRRLAFERIG